MNSKLNKIIKFNSILKQIDENWFVKLQFIFGFFSHYALKSIGIHFSVFPEMKIKLHGLTMLTRKNTIDFWVCIENYEPDIMNFFLTAPENTGTFIDVGANVGRYSLVLASKGWDVHAFEPVKSNFNQMEKMAKLNKLASNLHLNNFGLGEIEEDIKINFSSVKFGEASILEVTDDMNSSENIVIKNFKNLQIDVTKKPIIVKIDVEGYESNVINGMKDFIIEHKPMLILEIWLSNVKEISDFLIPLGYYVHYNVYWFPPNSPLRKHYNLQNK